MEQREPEHSNSVLPSLAPPQTYEQLALSRVLAYLQEIDADIHAIRVEIDAAKEAVRKSKNPIIRSLFPWL